MGNKVSAKASSKLYKKALALEVVSYFMVTLDLYGRERLQVLTKKLIEFNSKYPPKASIILKAFLTQYWIWYTILILIIVALILLPSHFHSDGEKSSNNYIERIIGISLGFFCMSIFFWSLGAFILITIIAWYIPSNQFIIKNSIDGSLLIIGTILYLISKAISYRTIQ